MRIQAEAEVKFNFLLLSVCLFAFYQQSFAEFDAVNIAFFYGNDSIKYELFSIASIDDIINHVQFDARMKTLLYIHGFRENLTSESVETIVRAFTKRGLYNKLVLNWSAYANGSYVTEAIPNLIKVTK